MKRNSTGSQVRSLSNLGGSTIVDCIAREVSPLVAVAAAGLHLTGTCWDKDGLGVSVVGLALDDPGIT